MLYILFNVGFLFCGFFWVIRNSCLFVFIVVCSVSIDFLCLINNGIIIFGNIIILCSGKSGNVIVFFFFGVINLFFFLVLK